MPMCFSVKKPRRRHASLSFLLLACGLAAFASAARAEENAEIQFKAYITGYWFGDNTPPESGDISNPVIHRNAGGIGTYDDPITLAVGHVMSGENDILDYPAGTKFYLPYLRRYVIVEDTCGDGDTPQDGPCHIGYRGKPWLDVYLGENASQAESDKCMGKITGVHTVIQNPLPTYPVVEGEIVGACRTY
jgi:hypothetical protein